MASQTTARFRFSTMSSALIGFGIIALGCGPIEVAGNPNVRGGAVREGRPDATDSEDVPYFQGATTVAGVGDQYRPQSYFDEEEGSGSGGSGRPDWKGLEGIIPCPVPEDRVPDGWNTPRTCGLGQTCRIISDEARLACGSRGSKGLGDACTADAECAQGGCPTGRCTIYCFLPPLELRGVDPGPFCPGIDGARCEEIGHPEWGACELP